MSNTNETVTGLAPAQAVTATPAQAPAPAPAPAQAVAPGPPSKQTPEEQQFLVRYKPAEELYPETEMLETLERAAHILGLPGFISWAYDSSLRRNLTNNPAGIELLVPSFAERCQRLAARLAAQGYEIRPYSTYRHPIIQMILWCECRTQTEVFRRALDYQFRQAHYLAGIIYRLRDHALSGRFQTNNLPGASWHQWGLAVDYYLIEADAVRWTAKHPGYSALCQTARSEFNFTSGYSDPHLKDAYHIQLPPQSPVRLLGWSLMDRVMYYIDQLDQQGQRAYETALGE